MSTEHGKFMAVAIEEGHKGIRAGERPFGAVIVRGDELIAQTYSVVESSGDPTAPRGNHGYPVGNGPLKKRSLKGCTLYASCEPCPMCAGAIFASQVERLVIGPSSYALTSLARSPSRSYSIEDLSKQINVKLEVIRGVLEQEAEQVLEDSRLKSPIDAAFQVGHESQTRRGLRILVSSLFLLDAPTRGFGILVAPDYVI